MRGISFRVCNSDKHILLTILKGTMKILSPNSFLNMRIILNISIPITIFLTGAGLSI